jgi:hypothetical protein
MKIVSLLLCLVLFLGITTYGNGNGKDSHTLFNEILKEYVHDGKVNYKNLCKDDRLGKYLNQLSNTNPDKIENTKERLAFWINAYNAFTLKIICDNYPVKSIMDLDSGKIWDRVFIEINGMKMSLNHIEHEIIRKEFNQPRIHFALVCAAISCPPLRSEAFGGYKLDDQLNDQGDIFLNQKDKNYFDLKEKEAHLSKILDWYGKDFGSDNGEILLYLTRFLPEKTATSIKENPNEWEVRYTEYDWSLNE